MAHFKIVPDPDNIGWWNVYEGWWIFGGIWREIVDGYSGTLYRNLSYSSVEHAKEAIDKHLAYKVTDSYKQARLIEWRKTPSIKYP